MSFRLTDLEIAALVVAALVLVVWLLMQRASRRDGREIALAAARLAVQELQVVEAATCFCLQAVREENTALLDDLAALHPMPQRPPAAPAEPGEPWQLRHAADDVTAGLVEPTVPNDSLNGEQQ